MRPPYAIGVLEVGIVLLVLAAMTAAYRWKPVGIAIGSTLAVLSVAVIVDDMRVRGEFLDGIGVFFGAVGLFGGAVFIALGLVGSYARATSSRQSRRA
jgi:hypothetical protein